MRACMLAGAGRIRIVASNALLGASREAHQIRETRTPTVRQAIERVRDTDERGPARARASRCYEEPLHIGLFEE